MSVLNMFDPDSAAPQGSIIIDTGAAVSVAPKRFGNVSSRNVTEKNDYNLVTASGSRLKVFGTQEVRWRFGDDILIIKFVICDVTHRKWCPKATSRAREAQCR